ncbi:MAG: sulfur carrier protein ThiS [Pseudomonadota bacterium]
MQIYINGETKIFESSITVANLIENFALDMRKVAIEVNLSIVPRSHYESTMLNEGDKIEIVRFIGGG